MTESHRKLALLWKRIEDARLQVHRARNAVRKINQDCGDTPLVDGHYAFTQALREEMSAAGAYFHALEEYYAAWTSDPAAVDQKPAVDKAITARERKVLALIASGKSSKQIAAELGISFRTAVCHRYRLYQKLNVHTNLELTRVAMPNGVGGALTQSCL